MTILAQSNEDWTEMNTGAPKSCGGQREVTLKDEQELAGQRGKEEERRFQKEGKAYIKAER